MVAQMPRFRGKYWPYHGTTLALRQVPGKGTIMCVIGDRPAIGKGPDGRYYCRVHMMQKFGFLPYIG